MDADEYYNSLEVKQRIIQSAANNHQKKIQIGQHKFFDQNKNLGNLFLSSLKEAKKFKLNFNYLFKKAPK